MVQDRFYLKMKTKYIFLFILFNILNLYSIQVINIQHYKINQFINRVKYLVQVDSVKTLIIINQHEQIKQYNIIVNSLQNKVLQDSLIIQLQKERLQMQIKKNNIKEPFYLKRQSFFIYGIFSALIILGLFNK